MKNNSMRIISAISAVLIFISMCVPLIVGNKIEITENTVPTEATILDPSELFVTETEIPTSQIEVDPGDPDSWTVKLSDDDIYLLATAIYLESGSESFDCQMKTGSVIINRMLNEEATLQEVLYAPAQFSVAPQLVYSYPTGMQIQIAMELVLFGPTLPDCVTFFRAEKYHDKDTVDTQYIQPYIKIDNTYFSHDIRICGNIH